MSERVVREAVAEDIEIVYQLNQAEAKWTSDLTLDALKSLVSFANVFLVAEQQKQVVGFVILVAQDSEYPNENLRWFRERLANFWYLDRVVVAKSHASKGLGRELYEHCFDRARRAGIDDIACEYSTTPMNEGSAAFHRSMGFEELGVRSD